MFIYYDMVAFKSLLAEHHVFDLQYCALLYLLCSFFLIFKWSCPQVFCFLLSLIDSISCANRIRWLLFQLLAQLLQCQI